MGVRLRAAGIGAAAVLFVFLCCHASYTLRSVPVGAARLLKDGAPGILRLHVIANSDGAEDQRVKLAVRDMLIKRFAPAGSLTQAEEIVLSDGPGIKAAVDAVLAENGCSYGAELRLGVTAFPDKTYGERVYPAGDYEALRVVLGSGEGQNWWCVLFPPLCLLSEGVEDIPGTNEIVFESWLKRAMQ